MSREKTVKEKKVYEIFQNIAGDYDRLNDVISFNMHKHWKKDMIKKLNMHEGQKVLDLCCGTGDLCMLLGLELAGSGQVIGMDFSKNMLSVAHARVEKQGLRNVKLINGNAMELPFEEGTFDAVTIGFGLRNTPDYKVVMKEIYRVTKPSGRIACLDTSHPTAPLFKQVYWFYFKRIMPKIGHLLSKHNKEYKWLNDSTRDFLSKEELRGLFLEVGIKKVRVKAYGCGAAALHIGRKPEGGYIQ